MKSITVDRFRAAARKGVVPDGICVTKGYAASVEAGVGERQIRFTISTGTVDRQGDTVSPKGWDLDPYRKNPVVLWGHDYNHLPVGKAVGLSIEDGALKALVEFVPFDTPDIGQKAEAVYQLLKGGFLSATSVGFRPLEYDFTEDETRDWGIDFHKQELLEFSIVTVPANPDALMDDPTTNDEEGKMFKGFKRRKDGEGDDDKDKGRKDDGDPSLSDILDAVNDLAGQVSSLTDRVSALEGDGEDKDGDDEDKDGDGDDDKDKDKDKGYRSRRRSGTSAKSLSRQIADMQRRFR